MNRFDCMQQLAARLKDELVVLSLGASVDEWYNAAPHMRSASLFQQQLGSTLEVVAKDAKLQVDFDPEFVATSRE